jgi:hypothetical protein
MVIMGLTSPQLYPRLLATHDLLLKLRRPMGKYLLLFLELVALYNLLGIDQWTPLGLRELL